jgi:hypothetical protein
MIGLGLGSELFILATALIIITIWMVFKLNTDDKRLKRMAIVFTLSYGLRSFYLFFYGYYDKVIENIYFD